MERSQTEKQLIDRLRGGDSSAVAELERAYRSKIFQLAYRYMKNHEDAEEVTQDVLFRVFRKIGAFRGDAALSSWIYRITFNSAMSRLRSVRFSRPFEVSPPEPRAGDSRGAGALPEAGDWSLLADDAVYRSQLRRQLVEALLELPRIYREPVILRDVQGLTTEEASGLLRVKPQTLKSRLHRGRLMLRGRLAEYSRGLSLHRA